MARKVYSTCDECGRKTVVRINGRYKLSKDHDLCHRCFVALVQRERAKGLTDRDPECTMP